MTGQPAKTVCRSLTAHLEIMAQRPGQLLPGPHLLAMRANLRYDPADPFAVVLAFRSGDENWVEWLLSRELLAEGLLLAAGEDVSVGEGDVRISPDCELAGRVWIGLSSPDGAATLALERAELEHALDATEALVPAGSETAGWDPDWPLLLLSGGE
ncbi:SsgA family sporulation/cell division regulator [Amycolatopsis nigrescens]|uniref:SsgA family sporulation/cell division regulator n=1 Tax=Amycolatopsis nigrescens TaxID=381445 RepID=UPI000374F0F8|nr:SsgA family sporulation/cell division regulator [Amycolatopsis nigrescens]